MKNLTAISIVAAAFLISGSILFLGSSGASENGQQANNVSVVDGKQIIEIGAKGGYSPRVSAAKADMPTILKIKTNGTFDCSSAVSIPSIGYRANLPPTGEKEIEIPPQKSGTIMRGTCAMGMYNFQVKFD